MSILNIFGITDALAQTAAPAAGQATTGQGSFLTLLPTLVIFILIFYFLLIRPQSKRAKEQRKLMDSLAKDDEIMTTGGIAGKIMEINDNFVVLRVAKDTDITLQKNSVAAVLPKGTLKGF